MRKAPFLFVSVLLVFALVAFPVLASSGAAEQKKEGGMEQAMEGSAQKAIHAEKGHESAHGGGESPERLWDLVYRVINAAAVILVLVLLVRKPLKQMLASRRQTIQEDLENLEARKKSAQEALEETLARLKDVEAEKEKILENFRKQGEAERDKILAEAEAMAEQVKIRTQAAIEQHMDQTRQQLQDEIAVASAQQAMELIKKSFKPEDQGRLVEEYLEKVVAQNEVTR